MTDAKWTFDERSKEFLMHEPAKGELTKKMQTIYTAENRAEKLAKPKMSLLPWDMLEGVARVMMLGEKKYGRDDWKTKGYDHSMWLDAIGRHISKMQNEGLNDEESGLEHALHIACNALFLAYCQRHEIGEQDIHNG